MKTRVEARGPPALTYELGCDLLGQFVTRCIDGVRRPSGVDDEEIVGLGLHESCLGLDLGCGERVVELQPVGPPETLQPHAEMIGHDGSVLDGSAKAGEALVGVGEGVIPLVLACEPGIER